MCRLGIESEQTSDTHQLAAVAAMDAGETKNDPLFKRNSTGGDMSKDYLEDISRVSLRTAEITDVDAYARTMTSTPALPDTALAAAQTKGRERYDGFLEALGRRLARGRKLSDEIVRDIPEGGSQYNEEQRT